MSKFSYSFTMQIFKLLPRVVDPEPNILNSALVECSSVILPPLDLIIPHKKLLFNQLLERQKNERAGNCCKFNYVAVTAQLPLHRVPGRRTPVWIIMHMGIEGEEKVSEWV